MPYPARLATTLFIASVVVGCDPVATTPAEDALDPVERAAEREALTAFYINTDGDNWTDRDGCWRGLPRANGSGWPALEGGSSGSSWNRTT